MPITWILVASSSQANLFSKTKKNGELTLLREFSHPESRQKGRDLVTDRNGHNPGAAHGPTHGGYQAQLDPREHERERFARELVQELENGRVGNSFAELVVVASPHFHGLLNRQMSVNLQSLVKKHIDKDYTSYALGELAARLREYDV